MVRCLSVFFFFNDTATTEIYTLSLHDALPIYLQNPNAKAVEIGRKQLNTICHAMGLTHVGDSTELHDRPCVIDVRRSEEHTSELQSRQYLVCRLLLEKKHI